MSCEIPRLNRGTAGHTGFLEASRGVWNSRWSGEMRRDLEERQQRSRHTGLVLTLRCESVGSEED